MVDLALSRDETDAAHGMFLVAPDSREADVRAQVQRPVFGRVKDLDVRYLPYSELERNREAAMRFGRGLHFLIEMSRALTGAERATVGRHSSDDESPSSCRLRTITLLTRARPWRAPRRRP